MFPTALRAHARLDTSQVLASSVTRRKTDTGHGSKSDIGTSISGKVQKVRKTALEHKSLSQSLFWITEWLPILNSHWDMDGKT